MTHVLSLLVLLVRLVFSIMPSLRELLATVIDIDKRRSSRTCPRQNAVKRFAVRR